MMKIFTGFLMAAALWVCSCSESGIVEEAMPVETRMLAAMNAPDSLVENFSSCQVSCFRL